MAKKKANAPPKKPANPAGRVAVKKPQPEKLMQTVIKDKSLANAPKQRYFKVSALYFLTSFPNSITFALLGSTSFASSTH